MGVIFLVVNRIDEIDKIIARTEDMFSRFGNLNTQRTLNSKVRQLVIIRQLNEDILAVLKQK
jgi:hypothetical protein